VLLLLGADREAHENVCKAEGERHDLATVSFVVGMQFVEPAGPAEVSHLCGGRVARSFARVR
jgi:hypothetical protein